MMLPCKKISCYGCTLKQVHDAVFITKLKKTRQKENDGWLKSVVGVNRDSTFNVTICAERAVGVC